MIYKGARDAFKDADDVEYASCVEATAIYTIESERNIAIQQITKPVPLQFKNNLEVLAHFIGSPNGSNLYGYMKHIPLSEDTKAGAVRDLYCELLFMLMPYGIEPYGDPKNTEIKPYEGPRDKQHRIVHNKDHFYFLHYNDPYVVGQCLFFAMLRSLFYADYSELWKNDIWRILNCRDLREMGIEIYDFYSSNMESARESIEEGGGLNGYTDEKMHEQLTFADAGLANKFFENTGFPEELWYTVEEEALPKT